MKLWLIGAGVIAVLAVIGVFVMGNTKASAQGQTPPQLTQADWLAMQKKYLDENAKKPEWKSTKSGLQYRTLKAVNAAPKPAPGSEVTVQYEGKLIDGQVFDSSYARNEPISFPLDGVIMGWQEGVPMMRISETWEFLIPANLAYGDRATGPIPPGSALIFKIELLNAKTLAK